MTAAAEFRKLERMLAAAQRASDRACARRAALPPGSSRARVTTANARWMRAAEERDRVQRLLDVTRAQYALVLGQSAVVADGAGEVRHAQ